MFFWGPRLRDTRQSHGFVGAVRFSGEVAARASSNNDDGFVDEQERTRVTSATMVAASVVATDFSRGFREFDDQEVAATFQVADLHSQQFPVISFRLSPWCRAPTLFWPTASRLVPPSFASRNSTSAHFIRSPASPAVMRSMLVEPFDRQ